MCLFVCVWIANLCVCACDVCVEVREQPQCQLRNTVHLFLVGGEGLSLTWGSSSRLDWRANGEPWGASCLDLSSSKVISTCHHHTRPLELHTGSGAQNQVLRI